MDKEGRVKVHGWVSEIRDLGKIRFIVSEPVELDEDEIKELKDKGYEIEEVI